MWMTRILSTGTSLGHVPRNLTGHVDDPYTFNIADSTKIYRLTAAERAADEHVEILPIMRP